MRDAQGEERKGIEVMITGYPIDMSGMPDATACLEVSCLYNGSRRFLSPILKTVRDLMLAGF